MAATPYRGEGTPLIPPPGPASRARGHRAPARLPSQRGALHGARPHSFFVFSYTNMAHELRSGRAQKQGYGRHAGAEAPGGDAGGARARAGAVAATTRLSRCSGAACGSLAAATGGHGAHAALRAAPGRGPPQHMEGRQRVCAGACGAPAATRARGPLPHAPAHDGARGARGCGTVCTPPALTAPPRAPAQARQAANMACAPTTHSVLGWWTETSKNRQPSGLRTCRIYHTQKNGQTSFIEAEVSARPRARLAAARALRGSGWWQ